MKVAIVGSRAYPNKAEVTDYVNWLPGGTLVISGGAAGVDTWAEQAAKARGLGTLIFHVDKTDLPPYPEGRGEFARRAKVRNMEIVDSADKVVAFWDGTSRGTKHTIDYARAQGKPVDVREWARVSNPPSSGGFPTDTNASPPHL